jgi:hypothetical protein
LQEQLHGITDREEVVREFADGFRMMCMIRGRGVLKELELVAVLQEKNDVYHPCQIEDPDVDTTDIVGITREVLTQAAIPKPKVRAKRQTKGKRKSKKR